MVDRRERLLDEILVLRCREGDRTAFEKLVERWQPRLWRHARRLTGRDDGAWDVVQEAWLSIARGVGRLRDEATFPRWAYRIVTRRASDWQRLRSRVEAVSDSAAVEPQVPELSTPPQDAIELLRRALRRLPGDRRALLSLRYFEEFDVAEVARILGIPLGTAKSRLFQAREELRNIMERMTR